MILEAMRRLLEVGVTLSRDDMARAMLVAPSMCVLDVFKAYIVMDYEQDPAWTADVALPICDPRLVVKGRLRKAMNVKVSATCAQVHFGEQPHESADTAA